MALVVAPALPILSLATVYWLNTGSKAWFPILLVFGYLFFLVLGVPIAAMLLKKRSLRHCLIGGGVAAAAPLVLLSFLSLFSAGSALTSQTLAVVGVVFLAGCVGGGVFWLIAFAGAQEAIASSPP
ncbi:hypothetical protein [Variovorax sp. YR566]|uniref:hypothetical protein n=1 Tax=Variovorax sp. YR566 TaxID=3450237 RepID=UPI003F7D58FE